MKYNQYTWQKCIKIHYVIVLITGNELSTILFILFNYYLNISVTNRCAQGFIGGSEKCLDIDECEESPCHPSATCLNLHGTYRCVCPQGTAGDPTGTGCSTPNQCNADDDCPDIQACRKHSCTDPCSFADCGTNAVCSVIDHDAVCQCLPGYIGDASGCFKVECLSNNDCPGDKYCNSDINKCASKNDFHFYGVYVHRKFYLIA
jgi:hypothetical protein